jgi:hypothetical protein
MSLRNSLYFLCLSIGSHLPAQTASNYLVNQTQSATTSNVIRAGYNTGTTGYLSSTNYNLNFGRTGANTVGNVPKLQAFQFNSMNYVPLTQSGSLPYDRIVINRKVSSSTLAQNSNKFTGFFEYSLINGNNIYFKAEYIDNLESLINSYVINRGVDNIFSNATSGTSNNVERVDLILNAGVVIPSNVSLSKLGALLLDRGGNDNYKIAVITSLDSAGKVSGIGNLVSRSQSNFSSTGYTLTSVVFQNGNGANPTAADNLIKPVENISSQAISGDFITFSEMGVTGGQVIYGIAVYPGDVIQGTNDLINLTDVPTNTDGTVNGGLDFMGGGGFFVASDVASGTITGNVYRDIDGNAAINGNGMGSVMALPLYAYLLAPNNTILSKVPVNSNGSFVFPSTILETSNTYNVLIDTRNVSGTYSFSSPILPTDWQIVGEDFGVNNLYGNGVEGGIPNLRIPIKFNTANPVITNIKFGLASAEDICTKPVNGSSFSWSYNNNAPSNPVTQSFNQPAANYGFVLDITKLDNSFNMVINGTPLATQEMEFQSNGTSGINVQFVDNSSYETATPFIYNMTGTETNPIIRVNISPTGTITMFGSKTSGGPLFPLKLINGNSFNTVTWNPTGTNTVVATQNVVGATNMSGRGYGLNQTLCICAKPGAAGTPLGYTNFGITTKSNVTVQDWPKTIPNGHLALDSADKGLVITHMTTSQRDALVPLEGMLIYNTDLGCVQLYRGNNPAVDNTRRGWNCITKGCNE